jgi:Fe-S-cluster containining protein
LSTDADASGVTLPGFPFRFRCRRSGNCCAIPGGVVELEDGDAERIAEHLGISVAAFHRRYVRPGGRHLVDGEGSRCVFLEDGAAAGCSIYPVRPTQCRTWPFWDVLRDDPTALAQARRICPGIDVPERDA